MDRGISIAMENWALLIQEAFDVVGNTTVDRVRCYEENHAIAQFAIEKLSEGNFEVEAAEFISNRKAMTRSSRDSIRKGLNAKPNTKAALLATDDAALPQFLDIHCTAAAGWQALQKHLRDLFPDDTDLELARAAWHLLHSARYRVARAITRMDIYLCWRCVHRGSIRGDIPDDAHNTSRRLGREDDSMSMGINSKVGFSRLSSTLPIKGRSRSGVIRLKPVERPLTLLKRPLDLAV